MRSISTTTCRTTDSCMTLSRSIWTALTAVFSPIRAVGWVLTCQKLRGRASQCGDPCCFLPVLMDFRSRCMIFVVSDKSSLIRPWLVFRRFWMRFFDEIMLSGVPGHVGVDVILLIMPKLREKRLGLSRYYSVFMIFLCLFSSSRLARVAKRENELYIQTSLALPTNSHHEISTDIDGIGSNKYPNAYPMIQFESVLY